MKIYIYTLIQGLTWYNHFDFHCLTVTLFQLFLFWLLLVFLFPERNIFYENQVWFCGWFCESSPEKHWYWWQRLRFQQSERRSLAEFSAGSVNHCHLQTVVDPGVGLNPLIIRPLCIFTSFPFNVTLTKLLQLQD